jgi:predicted AAA+ superfamily ATPase
MFIQRDILKEIIPFLKRKEFISIIGPRQSGKTTLLEILENYLHIELKVDKNFIKYITFEDRRLLAQFENDPISFLHSFMPEKNNKKFYLMIDEFQYAQEGGQKLKLIYDTTKNVKILITGSSSLDIKAKVGKFMVGRILNFHLYPFNFGEYLHAKNERLRKIYSKNNNEIVNFLSDEFMLKIESKEDLFYEEFIPHYENFCVWGGYPAVVLAKTDVERKKILTDNYNNYILKDIKTLLELATEKNLLLLSQHLASHAGNIIVYQNLGQISNLNYRNLKQHLTLLEETFICKEIKPFFKNRQKELSRNPKIFFMDMGFRNILMENMNELTKRSDAGAIIENAVFIKLIELCKDSKINFWRTKSGTEVDFILHTKGNIIPLEVKYSKFSQGKLSKSLAAFIDSFSPKYAVVLTKNYWDSMKRKSTKILFIPVYYL